MASIRHRKKNAASSMEHQTSWVVNLVLDVMRKSSCVTTHISIHLRLSSTQNELKIVSVGLC